MVLTKAEYGSYTALLERNNNDSTEYTALNFEIAGVGAGLESGFKNTRELRLMKYD